MTFFGQDDSWVSAFHNAFPKRSFFSTTVPLSICLSVDATTIYTTHFHSNIGIVIASNAWSLAILLFVFFYFSIPLVFEREVKEREEIVMHVESLKHTKRKIWNEIFQQFDNAMRTVCEHSST